MSDDFKFYEPRIFSELRTSADEEGDSKSFVEGICSEIMLRGLDVLSSGIVKGEAGTRLRKDILALDKVTRFVDEQLSEIATADEQERLYWAIGTLLASIHNITLYSSVSTSTSDYLKAVQASTARAARATTTNQKKKDLREIILHVEPTIKPGRQLKSGRKYASSLSPLIKEQMLLREYKNGWGAKVVEKEIQAILEERQAK